VLFIYILANDLHDKARELRDQDNLRGTESFRKESSASLETLRLVRSPGIRHRVHKTRHLIMTLACVIKCAFAQLICAKRVLMLSSQQACLPTKLWYIFLITSACSVCE
jgi:hypothetical protein